MKKTLVVSFLAALVCAPLLSFGQSFAPAASGTPASTPAPTVPPPAGLRGLLSLTPDEQQTLQAASRKAASDPDVKAAADKQFAAMKAAADAIVAKDPSLGPLFGKIEASASPGAQRPRLTPDEMQQLRAAHDSIKGTPEADAWQAATLAYRAALSKAMIAADPAVGPIIAKISHPPGMPPAGSAGSPPAPPATPSPSVTGSAAQ